MVLVYGTTARSVKLTPHSWPWRRRESSNCFHGINSKTVMVMLSDHYWRAETRWPATFLPPSTPASVRGWGGTSVQKNEKIRGTIRSYELLPSDSYSSLCLFGRYGFPKFWQSFCLSRGTLDRIVSPGTVKREKPHCALTRRNIRAKGNMTIPDNTRIVAFIILVWLH